jgi:hypothetical protein
MDDELLARAIASICGALTVLAESQDPKRAKPKDAMAQGLAYSDCWLDRIMPGRVHVDSRGNVSFDTPQRNI